MIEIKRWIHSQKNSKSCQVRGCIGTITCKQYYRVDDNVGKKKGGN
jgi:hypothetical protein